MGYAAFPRAPMTSADFSKFKHSSVQFLRGPPTSNTKAVGKDEQRT